VLAVYLCVRPAQRVRQGSSPLSLPARRSRWRAKAADRARRWVEALARIGACASAACRLPRIRDSYGSRAGASQPSCRHRSRSGAVSRGARARHRPIPLPCLLPRRSSLIAVAKLPISTSSATTPPHTPSSLCASHAATLPFGMAGHLTFAARREPIVLAPASFAAIACGAKWKLAAEPLGRRPRARHAGRYQLTEPRTGELGPERKCCLFGKALLAASCTR
jgi:hypothetical protein